MPDGKKVTTTFGHLSGKTENLGLKVGQEVKVGEQIGVAGYTGNAAGIDKEDRHTHIQVKEDGVFANPENYMKTKFGEKGQPIPVMEPFKPIVLPNFQITRDVLIPLDLRIKTCGCKN